MSELGQHSPLNSTEIEIIVDKAVRKTFITLGADLSDNRSIQALQKDFAYMRSQRVGGEKMAEWTKRSILLSFITGVLFALWQGFKVVMAAKGITP